MEVKKNPKADLTRKTSLFFSIALLITMSIVLTAFEWKRSEAAIADLVQRRTDNFEAMVDVLRTEIIPPKPIVSAPVIEEVSDEDELDDIRIVIDVTPIDGPIEPMVFKAIDVIEEPTDEPFVSPESPASFKGGYEAFYRYVGSKIKYPAQARRMSIEGKVYVEFVINRDGSVTDVRLVKGIGAGCDEEAMRVIESSPSWSPGKQRGVPVRQRMVLPVIFQLSH
ncbi:MAG TPA: energy transducer TonB [Cyclobacteriaceae bacterium]|nr:energy transducer TonB [Cyclobacteriaceae bacterium]